MEECEALCDRLVIMSNGELKCIGTSSHIKNKFGMGFTMLIKCCKQFEPNNDVNILEDFILKNIENSTIKGILKYNLKHKIIII